MTGKEELDAIIKKSKFISNEKKAEYERKAKPKDEAVDALKKVFGMK